ncbi:hypothetical protein Tco_1087436 [Tanacetum coccineum]
MSTLVFVDPESSTQADGAQSSRVPAPFPEDPYEAIRQACLVKTDTESEPSEDPIDTETPESPHAIASPTLLPDSTPPACHTEESEDSDTSGARSTSSDSTTPLSPDHPLTRTSPTPTPTRASFHRRTARMTVRAQPVMSPGHSARVAEAMALSDSALRKRYRSSYETSSSSSSPALPVQKRYRGTSKLILDTDSEEDEIGEEDTDEDEGHGLDDEGHGLDDEGHGLDDESHSMKSDGLGLEGEEEAVPEGQQRAVPVVGATASAPLGLGYGALRRRELAVEEDQPTLTTWIDSEDGIAYIDIPAYPPPAQTPPSLEWSSGSLPVSPAPFVVPSPILSPMISLTVPSLIASLVTALTATILVDEDQFIDDATHFVCGSLKLEHERAAVTFGALWRPVLALEAWARHVDTRMADMLWEGYDDHRLVHDMLVQQAALQHELQEIRGRVTALEQYNDSGLKVYNLSPSIFCLLSLSNELTRDCQGVIWGVVKWGEVVHAKCGEERYRFRSLELEQERTAVTFGALWRPVLALEAWAGHVDTRMADMSRAGYDDHRLVHDMLVQQAALQRELQEMRGRVTALEQERDRRER